MSFPLGEKDKTSNSKETDTRKKPLESITDPARRDEIEKGGMMMGPKHPGFRSGSQETQDDHTLRLPQGSIPPGARFDPIVPGDQTRSDQIGEQYGNRPIAGPDNDELLPPGQEAPKVEQTPSKMKSSKTSIFQDSTKRTGEGFGRGNFSGGGGGGGFPF